MICSLRSVHLTHVSVEVSECLWTHWTYLSLNVYISDMIHKSTFIFKFIPTLSTFMFGWLLNRGGRSLANRLLIATIAMFTEHACKYV